MLYDSAGDASLQAEFSQIRAAINAEDDDRLIEVVEDIRAEAGERSAYAVVTQLLQLARNPITDQGSAACIEIALQRYRARYGVVA